MKSKDAQHTTTTTSAGPPSANYSTGRGYATTRAISVTEKKLLLVFLYFFVLTVVSYTGFALFHRKVERYSTELVHYFECEEFGHDTDDPCDRDRFEFLAFPAATAVAFILIELSPLVNFVFVVNIQNLNCNIKSLTSSNQ